MSDTLYRKYRPQDFSSVVGQSHIVDVLKAQLVKGKVGQSYILIGPRGTDKTSVGRILAKAVNCTSLVDGNPCGKCDNCKLFQEGKSLDFVEIDAASNRSIDDIKVLKEKISFAPIQFKRKVYIIDEVHMLSKDAFNALLKTLEEPPTHALFILATTEVTKVPITILSRCQRFDFKLATLTNLKDVLRNISSMEKKNIEDEVLDTIAEMGRGSFRDSQSILQKLINHSEDNVKVNQDMALSILGLSQIKELTSLFESIYEGDNEKSQGILKEILIEGEYRYNNKIPPGYEDLKNKSSIRKYGDLIIWFEMIEKSKLIKKPILFVTDDLKEDWWKTSNKKKIPRSELIQEFFQKSDQKYFMYHSDEFMTLSEKYLNQNINPKSIEEAKDIRYDLKKLNDNINATKEFMYHEIYNQIRYLIEHNPLKLKQTISNLNTILPDSDREMLLSFLEKNYKNDLTDDNFEKDDYDEDDSKVTSIE